MLQFISYFSFANLGNSLNDTFLYYRTNFLGVHNFIKCFSGKTFNATINKSLNGYCLVFAICYFWLLKKWILQNVWSIKKWIMLENNDIYDALKLWHCRIIWYLCAGLKTIILCSVFSMWFVKYAFSSRINYVFLLCRNTVNSFNGILKLHLDGRVQIALLYFDYKRDFSYC